jgi:Protein of unknown function (DUF2855)
MTALLTRRDRLAETAWASPDVPPAPPGSVVVEVEAVALTANTFTYGLLGDALGYWDFYPTDRPGWGCLPAWGTGVVRDSGHADLPVGSRLFGLLPLADHCLLTPARVSGTAVRDGSAHRRGLPLAYQHYERLPAGDGPGPDEQLRALLHPLFTLAFLLAGQLRAQARPVVLTSASSRTGQALAQQLTVPVVGLTSPARVAAVAATGLFAAVLGYDAVDGLAAHLPAGAVTLVDLAGDAQLRARVRTAVDARTILVGATHGADGALRPGPGEEVFSAVDRLRTLSAEVGAAELGSRQERAWREYLARCGRSVVPRVDRRPAAVERAYREVLAGRCPPGHGHLVGLR